ncbi:hypothetical protein EVAR_100969_1 [Eumeta japonica]|uniref:Uncharacterized protein n=1 Tax=Eumeta variegata TaxID=151549 RepID=A0A4C2AAJ0_EUMVA|nr:hypothetical protein EVAR_100969_1 [Eumeta japonica]
MIHCRAFACEPVCERERGTNLFLHRRMRRSRRDSGRPPKTLFIKGKYLRQSDPGIRLDPLYRPAETCVDTISPLISQPVKQCAVTESHHHRLVAVGLQQQHPPTAHNSQQTAPGQPPGLPGSSSAIPLPNIAGSCGRCASPVVPSLVQKVLPNGNLHD